MCEILILKQTKKKTSKCRALRQTIADLNVQKKQKPANFDNTLTNNGSTWLVRWRAGWCLYACECYLERETTWPFAHHIHVLFPMVWRLFFFSSEENVNISPPRTQQQYAATRPHPSVATARKIFRDDLSCSRPGHTPVQHPLRPVTNEEHGKFDGGKRSRVRSAANVTGERGGCLFGGSEEKRIFSVLWTVCVGFSDGKYESIPWIDSIINFDKLNRINLN